MLGAIRDIDFLANLNVKHGKRMGYAQTVLKMKNPYDYFQAGVLVLNTKAMREHYTIEQWLTYARIPISSTTTRTCSTRTAKGT